MPIERRGFAAQAKTGSVPYAHLTCDQAKRCVAQSNRQGPGCQRKPAARWGGDL